MTWFAIAIVSHLVLALVNIADKFLLEKVIRDDRLYTFLVGSLGTLVWVLSPFVGLSWPGWQFFLIDIATGASFIIALLFFFNTLKHGDTSVVVPFIGGAVPVLVALGAYFFLGDTFTMRELAALFFLIVGGVIITRMPRKESYKGIMTFGIGRAVIAACFFALYFVLSKHIFTNQGFINGFILSQAGALFVALWMLTSVSFRNELAQFIKNFRSRTMYLFFVNQFFGAVGFFGLNYAISLASVALVNALQGVQYAFLLIFGAIISFKWPHIIKEKVTAPLIVEKSIAVFFIAFGLYLIAAS